MLDLYKKRDDVAIAARYELGWSIVRTSVRAKLFLWFRPEPGLTQPPYTSGPGTFLPVYSRSGVALMFHKI